MNQEQIYALLRSIMHGAGFLSDTDAATEHWTTVHQNAWAAFSHFKLGMPPGTLVPMNDAQVEAYGLSLLISTASLPAVQLEETPEESVDSSTETTETAATETPDASNVNASEESSEAVDEQDNDDQDQDGDESDAEDSDASDDTEED